MVVLLLFIWITFAVKITIDKSDNARIIVYNKT